MRRGKCKSCRATVLWVKMASGADMPLDPEPVAHGNVYQVERRGQQLSAYPSFEQSDALRWRAVSKTQPAPDGAQLYTSHFVTCPRAAEHRKPRPGAGTRRQRSEG